MKKVSVLLLVVSLACTSREHLEDQSAVIAGIESSIKPNLRIKGEEVPVYTIGERMEELGIPGLSMAVILDGKLAWTRTYGLADRSENRPVTDSTLFLAGSVSKPVAALSALQMSEEGLIGLDQNVNELLKSWKLPDNEFTENEKVTLRRILNHTAGLTVWGFPGYDKGDTIPTTAEVLDGKGNTDSVRVYKEPGESWMYSGGGYTIMQLMMTDIEGKDFPEIMDERVLGPLGMERSTYENPLPEAWHSIAATGYRTNGNEVEGKWPIYPEMAAAGLWTTPSQLAKYIIGVNEMDDGKSGIISRELTHEMLTPGMNGHGLGPALIDDGKAWGHGGADEGFRTDIMSWRKSNNGIVIMVNSDNGRIMYEVRNAIIEAYGWSGAGADVRTVVPLAEDIGIEYNGIYDFGDLGEVKIRFEDSYLWMTAPFLDRDFKLEAENDSVFFDRNDGLRFTFNRQGEEVTGLSVRGWHGKKVE